MLKKRLACSSWKEVEGRYPESAEARREATLRCVRVENSLVWLALRTECNPAPIPDSPRPRELAGEALTLNALVFPKRKCSGVASECFALGQRLLNTSI